MAGEIKRQHRAEKHGLTGAPVGELKMSET